eukprot:Skav201186  [mRNA]  locus=scaffold2736:230692:235800:+ [translate_table: standard]
MLIFWIGTFRYGEALHPGPELSIRTCNPTTMWNKLEDFQEVCDGILGVSESATTSTTQKILTRTFKECGLHCAWSAPVPPYAWSSSNLRGIAGGTAIVSKWPMRPVCEPLPADFIASNRFVEALVQYRPHRFIHAVSVYGPTAAYKHGDPLMVTNRLMAIAAQRTHRFKGPAVIMGDLNCALSKVDIWPRLEAAGWIDVAVQASVMNNHPLDMTSCDSVRHTFILANPELGRSLLACRTVHHHVFSTHPVLGASFSLSGLTSPVTCWTLPRSFDHLLHDQQSLQDCATNMMLQSQLGFTHAIQSSDVEDFARRWTHIAETSLHSSAVETDGTPIQLSKAYVGRSWKQVLKVQQHIVPVTKKARHGDYQPIHTQCSVVLRQRRRQLHRLQSLVRQLHALQKTYKDRALSQACLLWEVIVDARGFHGGFLSWILEHVGLHVNRTLPAHSVLVTIKDCFASWHNRLEQQECLAKSRFRKLQILEDLPKGGKVLFQRVQADQPNPLTHIAVERRFSIDRMAWKKEGLLTLRGGPFDQLDLHSPVTFQDQEAKVECVHHNLVTLDRPVKLRSANIDDLKLVQKTFVVEPSQMHEALFASWNKFFQRDSEDSLYTVSPEMEAYIHQVPRGVEAQFPPITGDDLHRAFASTKPNSARGSDGWSSRDLTKLPPCLCETLACLLALIERQECWPHQWVLAKTICLPKTKTAQSPMEIRPVTVMSKAYRVWSKLRGQQIALLITSNIPKQIGGASMHISSDIIALLNAFDIEDAQVNLRPTCGVVIDIIKAYNAIPRGGLIALMAWLGVPPQAIQGYRAMMKQMLRVFQVVQTCSECQHTTTGIIEGCSVAVPAMLAISIMAHHVILAANPSATTAIFADNWSFNASDAGGLNDAFTALVDMTKVWMLGISPNKSWAWATTGRLRKALHSLQVDGARIPVVYHEKDLGVEQSYCRRKHMRSIKDRLAKTKSRLKTIKSAKIPRSCRKRVVVAAALSNMNYTNGFVSVSKVDHHSLRTAAAKAMLRTGAGANAYLACNAVDVDVDPELRAIFHCFMLWRRFLRCFPGDCDRFLACCRKLASSVAVRKKPGPVANFVSCLRKLGIETDFTSFCLMLHGIPVDWLLTSMKTLRRLLHHLWIQHVSGERIDRKTFDITSFDAFANRSAFNKLEYHERSMVEQVLIGRHFTHDMLAKFLPGVDSACPMCGQDDSREHRLFECPAFQKFRTGHRRVGYLRRQWNTANWFFGLCPHIEDLWQLLRAWRTDLGPLPVPPRDLHRAYVFVDGSAHFGDIQDLTIAASAWIQVPYLERVIVNKQRLSVPGLDQSSFAAELFAVLLALGRFWSVTIYCDCASVCDLLWQVLATGDDGGWEARGLPLFWKPIRDHLARRNHGDIQIIKVKSHREEADATSQLDAWQIWGNNYVDGEAKAVFDHDRHHVYKRFSRAYVKASRNRQDILELYKFIAITGQHHAQLQGERRKQEIQVPEFRPQDLPDLRFPSAGRVHCPELSQDQYLAFPWNPLFLWRITGWLRTLKWGDSPAGGSDISLLELYIDFCLVTSSFAPVNVFTKKERDRYTCYKYVLTDVEDRVDFGTWTLSQQYRVWTKVVVWLHKHCPGTFFPAALIPRCLSLHCIGCSRWLQGFDRRPLLSSLWKPAVLLHDFFCTETGTKRTLDRPINMHVTGKPLDGPQWLRTPFAACVARIRKAPSIFNELNS